MLEIIVTAIIGFPIFLVLEHLEERAVHRKLHGKPKEKISPMRSSSRMAESSSSIRERSWMAFLKRCRISNTPERKLLFE